MMSLVKPMKCTEELVTHTANVTTRAVLNLRVKSVLYELHAAKNMSLIPSYATGHLHWPTRPSNYSATPH
jgi:hypothetical protein